MSSTNKELRYRCYCPFCNKLFDMRREGFVVEGKMICADCYHELDYATSRTARGIKR